MVDQKKGLLITTGGLLERESGCDNGGNYHSNGISKFYNTSIPNPLDSRLTIPLLRKGTINDLRQAGEKYVYKDSLGVVYSGLEEYLRIELGERRTPNYIFDNHNHALFAWCEAFVERRILMGATLVRFDEHEDGLFPSGVMQSMTDLSYVRDYVLKRGIYEFVIPALEVGLIGSIINVGPSFPPGSIDEKRDQSGRLLYLTIGMDNELIKRILEEEIDTRNLIVDIDMDHFDPFLSSGSRFSLEEKRGIYSASETVCKDIDRMQRLVQKAGAVTIATSPGYIEQSIAIEGVKELLGIPDFCSDALLKTDMLI